MSRNNSDPLLYTTSSNRQVRYISQMSLQCVPYIKVSILVQGDLAEWKGYDEVELSFCHGRFGKKRTLSLDSPLWGRMSVPEFVSSLLENIDSALLISCISAHYGLSFTSSCLQRLLSGNQSQKA